MRPPRYHRHVGRPALANCVLPVAPRLPQAATRRCAVRVVADLSARGRPILPKSITVQRIMGEGSFGQVFEGLLTSPTGNQRVVLKRVKTRVQGAEEMSQMEHLLNVYASRVARGHCADFLGYCEVADSEANTKLTSGLWLVWKYEGSKTLSYYLRRRDTIRALATDLEVPEGLVVQTVMRHIFEGLAAFHAAGLVHRDVKPLNMIMAEDVKKFKLIDLGACADLRSGTNYVPEESILDLNFCPPEQFVMPTDSPHIAKQAGLLKLAISPMLWAKHKPDRFDTWSAGIIMLQLAVPAMRTDRALRNFNAAYGPKYKYDLAAWRKGIHLPVRDGVLLDADDGAGWDLLQSLLAPRHIQVDDNGGVSFVNDTPFQRISAFEALKHRYIKGAAEAAAQSSAAAASTSGSTAAAAAGGPSSRGGAASADAAAAARKGKGRGSGEAAVASSSSSGDAKGGSSSDPLGSALGVWRDMTGRLFDLEARIMRQTSATELQTTTVKRLKEQVDSGKVDPALLQKEEKVLNKMQARLAGLQQDFSSTANQASGILSFFGFGSKQQQAQPQPPVADARAVRGSMDKAQQNLQALRSAGAASASAAAAAAGGASSSSASSSSSSSSSFSAPSAAGMFNSVWERLSSRLGELERKISNQASATERQSLVVRGLRAKVKAGEAEPEMLEKAERTLSRMERRLLDLDRDYWAAKQNAKGALAGNMPTDGSNSGGRQRSGSREQSVGGAADSATAATSRQSDSDNDSSGSFWSRLLGSRSGSSMDGGSMDGGSSKEAAQQASASAAAATPAQPPRSPSRSWSPMFRRSPSPTPAQQQAAAPPQQQPAAPPPPPPPQQSGYRSIFGAFGGLGSGDASPRASTSSTDQPASALAPAPAPPAATSSLPRSASPMRSASPRSGGFFGGLFGRPTPTQQRPVEPEPAATPPTTATSSSASASSGLPVPVPPPAAPASASGGDALVEGASRVIRNSLSFTGLAAKIAGDLATAFKADAERYMKELELQEAAKRQQRTLDLAFLALLREAQPPVSSGCSFEEAEVRFAGEARWAALSGEARRRELYGKYLQTARKVEEQAAAAADAAFRAALRRYDVSSASRWEDFRDRLLESDPAVAGVQDVGRRQQLFLEVVAELQLQAALQAASLKAELEFTTLLAALSDPPVTSTSTWALVRRAVAADPRCQALPERRRRELFEAYTARLFEKESARTTQLAEEEARAQAAEIQAAAPPKPLPLPVFAAAAATQATIAAVDAATSSAPDALSPPLLPVAEPPPPHQGVVVEAPAAVAVSVTAPHVPVPVQSTPGAEAPEGAAEGAAPPLDDDDLTAALAGMEAALESAIKAVASAPLPSAFALGGSSGSAGGGSSSSSNGVGGGSGGNNVVSVSPAQFHGAGAGAGPVNGVFNGAAVRKATPPASPGGGGGPAAAAASEGLRLEELRREQARLRAEYEAMAQRLREMEERLKGQAQLMSSVDGEPEVEAEPGPETQAGELQAGGSGGANGNGLTHSGSDDSMAAVRGGHRWR